MEFESAQILLAHGGLAFFFFRIASPIPPNLVAFSSLTKSRQKFYILPYERYHNHPEITYQPIFRTQRDSMTPF